MDVNVDNAITLRIKLDDSSQIGQARREAQRLATDVEFDETDAGRVALVATELSSNLLKHAAEGEIYLRAVPGKGSRPGIELVAIDRGQGFDLNQCLMDGFSTKGSQGIGLGAVSRVADVFDVYSDARGSVIFTRLYSGATSKIKPDIRFGVNQHSLRDDPACGDGWNLVFTDRHVSALVIDGLGHGPGAQEAASAGCAAFASSPFVNPAEALATMHSAMNGTRGGAAAIAVFDRVSNDLQFSGIGNIAASIITPESARGLASHPGILGVQFRKAQTFAQPHTSGKLLIMHSDGIQSRWDLKSYPGLWHRHPAVIAALLTRDFSRGNDDATVLVVALESMNV